MTGKAQEETEVPANDGYMLSSGPLVDSLRKIRNLETVGEIRREISSLREERDLLDLPDSAFIAEELRQAYEAYTVERARYYIDRLVKSLTVVREGKINDLNLNRWKELDDLITDSLWILENRDRSGTHNAGYWGNFVPQIPRQLMKRFTKKGDWVLDPFSGSGTTLIESLRLGRNCIGVDLSQDAVDLAARNLEKSENPYGVYAGTTLGDSSLVDFPSMLKSRGAGSVQLVIMHPPYWDIIKFTDNRGDLSNSTSLDAFLNGLGNVAEKCINVLDRGRYLALVIGDKYTGGEWIPLGFRAMSVVQERGMLLKSVIVKNYDATRGKRRQEELWRYRALLGGFYLFKHEYIFLFQKPV